MFKQLRALPVLSFVVFLLLFSGCSFTKADTETPETDDVTLRILYSEWPPDMMAYLAQELGLFEANNVDVELVWVDGFEAAVAARENGETDIWNYTLLDFVTEYAEGIEQEGQIIFIEDFSAGADAVMTLPAYGINNVADLDGKTVGVEQGTIGEFFLNILLERVDLSLEDLEIVDMGFDEVPLALANGEIDAGVTYEPAISQILNEGGEVLVDSEKERDVIVDVYVAKKDHLLEHPIAYQRAVESILDAGEFFNNNPEEAAEIIKGPLNMTTEEVLETFDKLRIPSLRDNKTAFNRSSGFASLYIIGRLAQQYLEEQGVLIEYFDLDPLINSSIIDSL